MFHPTEPISFSEILNIIERSWEKMRVTNGEGFITLQICQFKLTITQESLPEYHVISIQTPHKDFVFRTWYGSPYEFEENGQKSCYQEWEVWFFETISKITFAIHEKSRDLFRLLYFIYFFTKRLCLIHFI